MGLDNVFSEAGFQDVQEGAELFDILHIGQDELRLPENQRMLLDMADFINAHPGEGISLLRRAAAKQPLMATELLKKLNSFVTVQRRRSQTARELEKLDDEINIYL